MHIGLMRLSAMGDVVLVVPTIRTLQARYPKAKITWITSPSAYAILKDLSGVEFIVIDKPNNLTDYIALYKKLKPYHFDVFLCMQASFRANILYPLITAKRRIGFSTRRELHHLVVKEAIPDARDHLLDSFMRFAEVLDCHEKKYDWNLPISEEDYDWVNTRFSELGWSAQSNILAINPSASKQERCWLKERYVEVIRVAKQRWNVNVLLTGGASVDEKALAKSIENELDFPIKNWVGETTAKQLAATLSKVNVLLSPDTGPLHLAVAMKTPVIGLYAVAPSALSGPYFSRELTIDKFEEAVRFFLRKEPAEISWKTRVHTQEAMALITVDEVLEKLEKVFVA
jgi:heptosyltransferase I